MKKKEPSSFDLPTYLESKFAIDSASLNAPLYARFREHLRRFTDPRILDLGTGTGAMLRRVIQLDLSGRIHLTGLDQEEQNLAAAVDRMESILEDRGYRIVEKRRNSAAGRQSFTRNPPGSIRMTNWTSRGLQISLKK